ncbi:MAG: hypothetical protein HQM04_02540 [Magnetococcales bacterium]|nr:hypothetical protein [Magnetococcales bacterium]MBF0113899.1 hypothetical protein [Magnetococcales bacterium]
MNETLVEKGRRFFSRKPPPPSSVRVALPEEVASITPEQAMLLLGASILYAEDAEDAEDTEHSPWTDELYAFLVLLVEALTDNNNTKPLADKLAGRVYKSDAQDLELMLLSWRDISALEQSKNLVERRSPYSPYQFNRNGLTIARMIRENHMPEEGFDKETLDLFTFERVSSILETGKRFCMLAPHELKMAVEDRLPFARMHHAQA